MKTLYLVRGNDADGENQDLFVVADDPAEATKLWNEYCVGEGWARSDMDDGEDATNTVIDPANIREILPDVTGTPYAGKSRGISWNDLTISWEA